MEDGIDFALDVTHLASLGENSIARKEPKDDHIINKCRRKNLGYLHDPDPQICCVDIRRRSS